jgi:hypothetical protein
MKRRHAILREISILSMVLSASCNQDPAAPRPAGPESGSAASDFRIVNDSAYLDTRLQLANQPLQLLPPQGRKSSGSQDLQSIPVQSTVARRLTLVGEVLPPSVDGRVVQANDIDIDEISRFAIVGYNFAGEPFAGALQVIDFRQEDHPVLVSEVQFHGADVNAVCKRGTYVFAGLASSDPALASPALLRQFQLLSTGLVSTGRSLDLPSWSVTDVCGYGEELAATVGARLGGLALVDRVTLHLQGFAADSDARACSFDATGNVLDACGGPARLSRRGVPGLQVLSSADASGFGYEGAKGTLEVLGPYSYVGAGDGGFQVLDPAGVLLDSLANSDLSSLGPDLAVTNAVSVPGGVAFVAAGALGLQVVDLGRWQPTPPAGSAGQGLSVLGQIDFGNGVSSNMVKARSNILVVAGGLGGVKLVRMDPVN